MPGIMDEMPNEVLDPIRSAPKSFLGYCTAFSLLYGFFAFGLTSDPADCWAEIDNENIKQRFTGTEDQIPDYPTYENVGSNFRFGF